MNRYVVCIFILFNLALSLYLWRYFRLLKEINDYEVQIARERVQPTRFIPTHEWQPVARDLPLPAGLHVRVNLQTGEREAKLLSPDLTEDEKKLAIVPVDETQPVETENKKHILMKEALKNIPNDDLAQSEDDVTRVKEKFRSYEELKKEMAGLNLVAKTSSEILKDLMTRIEGLLGERSSSRSSKTETNLKNALTDLEYVLSQFDIAQDFAEANGIASVITPLLVDNSTELQTKAAKVLGSAVQNNAKVQIAALKAGVIQPLLRNIALEKDNYDVRSSSIFALSCLVRSFPLAEVKLIEEGGLSVLLSLFDENSIQSVNLQVKVVTFFNDLLLERDDAQLTVEEDKLLQNVTDQVVIEEIKLMIEKLKQYNSVGLRTKLVERGWCPRLSKMLAFMPTGDSSKQNINLDLVDNVIHAMATVSNECYSQFKQNEKLISVLKDLFDYYQPLARGEDADVFGDVFVLIDELCTKLAIK